MISVIIPAHNEENYIEECLKSITKQTMKTYEIIVVCDACTDKTASIAKHHTKKVITINKKNVSGAKNYGAKKAKGNILVFLDADCVAAPTLFEEIVKAVKKGSIAGYTKTYALEDGKKAQYVWTIGNFFRNIFPAGSGMLFCTKEVFTPFDETRKLAEDTHFLIKIKQKGKLAYLKNTYIKTSSRRFEREGYVWTIVRQFTAFFIKNKRGY